MAKIKHFGNCKSDEFMPQALKFREPFAEWLKRIGAPGIRKRASQGYDDLSPEEKLRVNNVYLGELLYEGMSAAPDLTRECLCIATFTDPDHFNDHSMVDYMEAAFAMYGNPTLRNFFTFFLAPILATSSGQ